MYSFAQREDTTVSDEPFYANYLHTTGIQHPGRDEVLATQSINRKIVQENLLNDRSLVFFIKNMAHHYQKNNFSELLKFKNILYIRNPRATIRSYARVIKEPTIKDIGIEKIKEIYDFLLLKNHKPIIFDSDDLIRNPTQALHSLCEKLHLKFTPAMLTWNSGPKFYDGVWAKHWYASVHNSTGFVINPTVDKDTIKLSANLESLAQTCMPIYQELKQYAKQQRE